MPVTVHDLEGGKPPTTGPAVISKLGKEMTIFVGSSIIFRREMKLQNSFFLINQRRILLYNSDKLTLPRCRTTVTAALFSGILYLKTSKRSIQLRWSSGSKSTAYLSRRVLTLQSRKTAFDSFQLTRYGVIAIELEL